MAFTQSARILLFREIRPSAASLQHSARHSTTRTVTRNASHRTSYSICTKQHYSMLTPQRHQSIRQLSQAVSMVGSDNVVRSHRPSVPVPDVSLGEFLMQRMEQYGNKEAVVDIPTQRRLTFHELRDAVVRVTSGMSKLGIGKGDVVCVCATNCLEYVVLLAAVMNLGAALSPISPACTVGELSGGFKLSGTSVVVAIEQLAGVVDQACADNPNIKTKICIGSADGWLPFSRLMEDDGLSFSGVAPVNPREDVALLPFSSGTTGLPKCVMLTHANVLTNVLQFSQLCPVEEGLDRVLAYLPFFHAYGLNGKILYSLNGGASLHILPRFTDKLLDVTEQQKITLLHVVPPICLFIIKHPNISQYDLSSLRLSMCSAASIGKDQIDAYIEATKVDSVIQGYGLTETSPIAAMDSVPARVGSVGQPAFDTAMKVVDLMTGETLGPKQDGEIYIQGPQVMAGYLNNPEATKATLQDGWLLSGDVGHYDEDGYFYITDRVKELIKYKATQVAPAELEALLLTHPGIRDAAVIGVPDEEAGELPRAYIVLKEGTSSEAKAEEIAAFLNDQVAPHKKLRGGVKFVEEIPKSPAGKILRRIVKEKYL